MKEVSHIQIEARVENTHPSNIRCQELFIVHYHPQKIDLCFLLKEVFLLFINIECCEK